MRYNLPTLYLKLNLGQSGTSERGLRKFSQLMKKSRYASAFFSSKLRFGNENLRSRTSNLDQTVIGATALLVLTYFLVLLKSRNMKHHKLHLQNVIT